MNRGFIKISMPNHCAWCGSDFPIKSVSVWASHREEKGLIRRKVRHHSLDLNLPICSLCDEKMLKGNQFSKWVFLYLGVAGTIFVLWFYNLVGENKIQIFLCGLFGAIFSFGGAAYLSELVTKIFRYPDIKNWGKYDGQYLYFKNRHFANQFYLFNPHLASPRTRNF